MRCGFFVLFFFFKQKTAYEMRISDWSSDVCSSDLAAMLAMVAGRRLGHLLDIGTGTGRMAEIFAPTVRRITALDRSPDMLRIARAKIGRASCRERVCQDV